jgi:hypothetical protein
MTADAHVHVVDVAQDAAARPLRGGGDEVPSGIVECEKRRYEDGFSSRMRLAQIRLDAIHVQAVGAIVLPGDVDPIALLELFFSSFAMLSLTICGALLISILACA